MSTNEDSIVQAQRIVDLRARMLQNLANGRPSHEGIPAEEISAAINGLRASRQVAGSRGGTASGKAKGTPTPAAASSLNDKLAKLGFNLD